MLNNQIVKTLLAQAIRHGLSIAAGLLTAYGVTADQQTAVVGPATAIVISVVMFLISQVWSAASKQDALDTPPERGK